MKAKYIIVEEHGLEVPIVFCPILSHKVVAGGRAVISAGFCQSNSVRRKWATWGHSQTLNIQSRPEDADLLGRLLEIDI